MNRNSCCWGLRPFTRIVATLPPEVLVSQECDLYPKNRSETANLLEGELGRGSRRFRSSRDRERARLHLRAVLDDSR